MRFTPAKELSEENGNGNASECSVRYVVQEEAKGLGHAVLLTEKLVGDKPFMLLLPDDIFENNTMNLKQMAAIYLERGGSTVAIAPVLKEDITRYGIIDGENIGDGLYQIRGLVEKPVITNAPSNLAVFGRYILSPDIFSALKDTGPGRNGEIQLTDALNILLRQQSVYGYEFKGEKCDCGTLTGWIAANVKMALAREQGNSQLREMLVNIIKTVD